jgi:cell division septal protein FtsQ
VTIAAVRVEGVHTIIPSQIETAVFRSLHQKENTFFSRSTIATAHMGGIEAFLLNEFPQIKTVQVRRYGMTTLRVDVVERTQFALWCSESEICFSVDENGMLYESAERQNSDSIIISGGLHAADGALREKILGDRFSELTALIAAFTAYDLGAERVHISSDMSDATFTFPDTPDVIVLLRDVPTTVARIVATALRDSSMKGKLQGLEYVDARYGARVYYKKRNEEPRESAEGNTVR